MMIIFMSVEQNCDGDLANAKTFPTLLSLSEQGFIDVWGGGPPRSTVSAARFLDLPGGPRPVRARESFWGLRNLTTVEQKRVAESNQCYVNFMALCEAVSSRGGAHFLEHPMDRGQDPFPSLWATEEMISMEQRTGAIRANHNQCFFGASRPKATCLSGTLDGLLELDQLWCPGESAFHVHEGASDGRVGKGGVHSRRLQTYCPGYAKQIALRIFRIASRL